MVQMSWVLDWVWGGGENCVWDCGMGLEIPAFHKDNLRHLSYHLGVCGRLELIANN